MLKTKDNILHFKENVSQTKHYSESHTHHSRQCESIQLLVSGSLDGELTKLEQKTLEKHLESCFACNQYHREMKGFVLLLNHIQR